MPVRFNFYDLPSLFYRLTTQFIFFSTWIFFYAFQMREKAPRVEEGKRGSTGSTSSAPPEKRVSIESGMHYDLPKVHVQGTLLPVPNALSGYNACHIA